MAAAQSMNSGWYVGIGVGQAYSIGIEFQF